MCFRAATINVPAERRGPLFGVGGYRIKAITEETDVIVEGVDEGTVSVFAPSQEAMDEAMEKIDAILNEEIKVGWLVGWLVAMLLNLEIWCIRWPSLHGGVFSTYALIGNGRHRCPNVGIGRQYY